MPETAREAATSALVHKAERAIAEHGVPGVAFGIAQAGETAMGAAGNVRPQQLFRVASVTKPFVAALVLTLVRDGLVSLDESVTRYLPELALPAGPVTLRQLLSHQAGLGHEWSAPLADYGDGDDALEGLARGAPAAGAPGPGEWFSYASAGYYIASAAVARVAGTTFETAMRERVLEPFGLRRTTFELAEAERLGLAPGEPLEYPRARRGGGGLFSCVPDLLAFGTHLLDAPDLLAEMALPLVRTGEGWYGLGIDVRELRGCRILEHGGSVPGWQSLVLLVPERRFVFVGLANSSSGRKAIDQLRDLALERACDLPPEEPGDAPADPALLRDVEGLYRSQGFTARLAPADGGLRVELVQEDERVAALATPYGDGMFRIPDGEEEGLLVELLAPGLVRVGGMVARRSG
jgi:D-alanyl-D-alanine carboxypeptidase